MRKHCLVFNPLTVACCKEFELYKDKKCVLSLFGTSQNPATSCLQIFEVHKYGASKNGYFQLKLAGNTVQAYCKFDGDYPGATLVARKQGRIGGEQQKTGRMRYPCKPSTSSGSYCKLSDAEINILRDTSKQKDAFVSLSYKNRNPNRPACRSFAAKTCKVRCSFIFHSLSSHKLSRVLSRSHSRSAWLSLCLWCKVDRRTLQLWFPPWKCKM